MFEACVRSALLHGSETWAPTAPDVQRLRRNDRSMIKSHDEISIDLLCARLGIQEVTAALRSKRLRWYGHQGWHETRVLPYCPAQGNTWKTRVLLGFTGQYWVLLGNIKVP